ncbi:MAG: DapH/DapD/GlmU-related protein, partial [Pseudomonadota bacterium]
VGNHVYIGSYALFGSVALENHTLVGSRVSILSAHPLHELDEDGYWTPYDPDLLERITIGENTWIGEAAVIGADIGSGAMIGAGSVVTTPIRGSIVVAGNPARFVRKLEIGDEAERA